MTCKDSSSPTPAGARRPSGWFVDNWGRLRWVRTPNRVLALYP